MSERLYLLDTSAALALIENEPGAERVEALLREGHVLLPWTVLLEVLYITRREVGQALADQRYAMLKRAATVIWEMDEGTLLTAARLKADNPVSLADALVAAYAIRQGATLVHKDPEYGPLASEVDLEALPYKSPPPSADAA